MSLYILVICDKLERTMEFVPGACLLWESAGRRCLSFYKMSETPCGVMWDGLIYNPKEETHNSAAVFKQV